MAANTTHLTAERKLAEELFRLQQAKKTENGAPGPAEELALAPLVDRIAYTIASGLVVAMKELENHIASETRKVGDAVGRRLDALQASFDELSGAMAEQRSINQSVQQKCQDLSLVTEALHDADTKQEAETASLRVSVTERIDAVTASVKDSEARQQADTASRLEAVIATVKETDTERETRMTALQAALNERLAEASAQLEQTDARRESDMAALRASLTERIDGLCKDLSVHQEDMVAVKSALGGFSKTLESLVERLDRQADALRSMSAAYAQRETDLEQLVQGLARLRAYPAPAPVDRL
jgi:chromosome segregation ATPase